MTKTKNAKAPAIKSIRFPKPLYERVSRDAREQRRHFSQQVVLLVEKGLRELEKTSRQAG